MRSFLVQHWFLLVLAFIVGSALAFPGPLHPLTDIWEPRPTIAISLFLMAWTMPTRSLFEEIRRPMAALWAVVLSYVLVPICAWLFGFLGAVDDVQVGLVLVASVPCTLSSAILWTRMAGGNDATALLATMGTTFLSWGLTTLWLLLLTGTKIDVPVPQMMLDLVLTLILPVVGGQLLRRIPPCKSFADRYRVPISIFSQFFVLAIILKAGVGVGDKLHVANSPDASMIFLSSVVLAIALHMFALASGWFSSGWLGFERGRQIAVAFSASQKTLQISVMLFDEYYSKSHPYAIIPLLFYHVGQLLLDTVIARRIANNRPATPPPDDLEASA
jgi:solute carrier family 10 (sodium/bile acid cotransporter), member 7